MVKRDPSLDRPYKHYFNKDEYEERKTETSQPRRRSQTLEYEERERPREIKVERRTIHKMLKEEELEPLRKVSPKVIGGLFDRVEFLRQRINEVKAGLDTRKHLHGDLINEINTDIRDKERLISGLSNIDDIRDFKLDVSTLRMEKRRENVQFWRDIFQLSTELRELIEEYETESKIANLFRELKPGE